MVFFLFFFLQGLKEYRDYFSANITSNSRPHLVSYPKHGTAPCVFRRVQNVKKKKKNLGGKTLQRPAGTSGAFKRQQIKGNINSFKRRKKNPHTPPEWGYWTVPLVWNHLPTPFPLGFPLARKAHPLTSWKNGRPSSGAAPLQFPRYREPNRTHKSSCFITVDSPCVFLFRFFFIFFFYLHCKTLPSCGFCSTALAAVAQDQQAGNVSPPNSVTVVWQVSSFSHFWLCSLVSSEHRGPCCCSASQWVTLPGRPLTPLFRGELNGTDPLCVSCSCADCREEMYPCTRMYSIHRPIKQCVGAMCFYRWVDTLTFMGSAVKRCTTWSMTAPWTDKSIEEIRGGNNTCNDTEN